MTFDPMTPVPDPFPALARVREDGGVAEVAPGFWLVARYDLVRDGFRASECLSNRAPSGRDSDSLVHLDGDEHRTLRRLLARAFTPRAMRSTDGIIGTVADHLLDGVLDGLASGDGQLDLVSSFTRPLPTIVMAEILGVPAGDRDRFVAWSDEAVAHAYLPDPAPTGADFESYIRSQIERARDEPGETLLHYLIDERDGQGSLSDDQLHAAVRLLIIAGNETTANLLGTLFHQLLVERARWERLLNEPERIDAAVEEALRFDPPLNWVPRVTASVCPVGHHAVPEGSHVGLGVGAANRDPAVFDQPDVFDLDRDDIRNRHLTFGYGEHYCLGAVLARVEASTALARVMARLPGLALVPGQAFAPKGPIMMRGVAELRVTLLDDGTA